MSELMIYTMYEEKCSFLSQMSAHTVHSIHYHFPRPLRSHLAKTITFHKVMPVLCVFSPSVMKVALSTAARTLYRLL